MQIPSWPDYDQRELELLKEVLESRQWGGFNPVVARFEREFAAHQQCAHCVTAVNGTVTLETALTVLGVGPGDEVIVPAISFISTATAVSRVGATPVFADIGEHTFNLDPERASAAVGPRTKAIIAVHFGGAMADMDALGSLAKERGLHLIEDAAHAHGSEWGGRRAGSLGICGSFSFQNSKVMTAGEGGALTSNDDAFSASARAFVNQGRREGGGWFHHYTLGTNLRITAWQAAVLVAQLERLPSQIRRREANVRLLKEQLEDVPGLRFQDVPARANVVSWYLLLGRIDAAKFGMSRDEFHRAMTSACIPCTPYYPHTLYENPLYQGGGCRVEPCPNAEATVHDAFWFPCRTLMADEETTRGIAAAIQAAGSVPAARTGER
jgi:dTDP-4-amino-4,6-dideoxygalactose transaminase